MADIILAGDSFSLKKLRSAAEQLEDAQNLMQKVYDAVFSTSFWAEANPFALLDGSKNMNVFDGTIDELHTYQQRVHQKEETLRTLAQRIEAAVRELAETDQSFRGKLSGESEKNTWERFKSTVRILVQPVSTTAILLIGAINGLFSSDAAIGGETRISGFAEAQIANAYRQFDWTDIEPTDEEINEIAANSKNEADLLKQFQTLHADKMRMESEAIYAEFDWRGISVTDEEKTAVIQKASGKNELRMLFEKLHNEKLDAMTDYEKYRRYAEIANAEYTGEVQHYQKNGVISKENLGPDTGQCNWVAATTIIRRRRVIERKDASVTCENLLIDNPDELKSRTLYYGEDGYDFHVENYGVARKFNEEKIVELLKEHPDGIAIRSSCHWITITDYEIVDGRINLYADDGVNNSYYSSKNRIPINETWWKSNGGSLENIQGCLYLEN